MVISDRLQGPQASSQECGGTSEQATGAFPAKPSAMSSSGPRVVLCIGLFSSGSTWAFNVAGQLCRLGHPSAHVLQIYADNIDDDLELKIHESERLIIKSHAPSPKLQAMAYLTGAPVVLTARDPRDAVVSLMSRFALPFDQALHTVEASCRLLAGLSIQSSTLLLRYEDGFHELSQTVNAIANCLGVQALEHDFQKIFNALTPSAVTATIKALEAKGVFRDLPPIAAFDSYTHWHPGHIGDRRVGKWIELLTAVQAAHVAYTTRSYCDAFNYNTATPINLGAELLFSSEGTGAGCLGDGFSIIESWGVWIDSPIAKLRIKFTAAIFDGIQLELQFQVGAAMLAGLPGTAFRIFVNNVQVLELRSSQSNSSSLIFVASLDSELVAGRDNIDLRFESVGMLSPADLGAGVDNRKIALGITRLSVNSKLRSNVNVAVGDQNLSVRSETY